MAATGATCRSPASCASMNWDDINRDQFDLQRRRDAAGASTSARTLKVAEGDVAALPAGLRRGHPELHERCAGGRRHRAQPGNAGDAGDGKAIPPRSALGAFIDHNWNEQLDAAPSAIRCGHRQPRRAADDAFKTRPIRARQPAVHAGAERDGWRRAAVGQAARTSAMASRPTASRFSFRSSTTSRLKLGGN